MAGYLCPHANVLGQYCPNSLPTGNKAVDRLYLRSIVRGNPNSQARVHGIAECDQHFGPHLFIIIHNHLRPESSRRITHDSHKLQTKAINHKTCHYINCRELESDQPIHVQSLRVFSLSPSAGLSALSLAGRRAPHLATTRKDTPATVQRCYSKAIQRRLVIARTASTLTCHMVVSDV